MALAAVHDLRTLREIVVHAHIYAEAVQHDIPATLATFTRPRYEIPAMGGVIDGQQAVNDLLSALLTAFPDFWLRTLALHHADDAVIVECRFGGTHRGTWAGIPASNRQMEVQAVLIYLFEREHLVCEKVYFDQTTIIRQIVGNDH